MRFSQPIWLLAFAVIPLFVWLHRRGAGSVPERQRVIGLFVRCGIVAMLTLALAGASIRLPERRLATVFVADVSDSVGPAARDSTLAFIDSALDAKPLEDMAGVVAFGREPRVEQTVSDRAQVVQIASRPDPSRTDLARALRLAAALLPEGTRRRIVVLSDGRENSGDARAEAARLRKSGIRVDTVTVAGARGQDASVTGVDAPSRVRVGEEYEVGVTIQSNGTGPAHLVIHKGDQIVDERDIELAPGEQTVKIAQKADASGSVSYRAELSAAKDSVPQNDTGAALVLVNGPPRIVLLEGAPDEGQAVAQALTDRGFTVDRRAASAFPSGQELAAADGVVLVDVDASALTNSQVGVLSGFVRELGRGLVAVGGENSWSLGGYRNSALEDLLPLESDIKDPRRRPSIAQVLAVDTSGSMATCHCAGPNMSSGRMEQGPNKTDISRSASAKAIEALTADDEVGVLAFNTSSNWVLPLQKVPSQEVINKGLARMTPTGGTSIPQALQTSVKELQSSKSALKHIILFTDGWTATSGLADIARWVHDQGITLSVVATGEGTGTELARMAEEGGGRFYAGTNLYRLPEIFMSEVTLASRRYVNEGEFFPKITGASAAAGLLTQTPPLLGYIGTSAKPSASVSLSVGEFDDPLLASWRTGLGVATAWTSDAKARWSAQWIGWEGFADFWSNVVKETLPGSPAPGYSTQIVPTGDGLQLTVESETPFGEGVDGVARVVLPSGEPAQVRLERSGPNRLTGALDASAAGSYLASVDVSVGGTSIYRDTVGAVRSYSGEYGPGGPDEALLKDLASTTRGRTGIEPAQAFDANLPSGRRYVEIWHLLALIAAILFPLDVALRRVIVTKEDVDTVRAWRPARLQAPAERTEGMDRLLKAKYRVQQIDTPPAAAQPAPVESKPAAEAKPAAEPAATKQKGAPDAEPALSSGIAELARRKRERGNQE